MKSPMKTERRVGASVVRSAIQVMNQAGQAAAAIASELRVRTTTLNGWADGSRPVTAANAATLARRLCFLARHVVWKAENPSLADSLLGVARQFGPEVFQVAYRFAKQEFLSDYGGHSMNDYLRTVRVGRLDAGLHVAPFLSESGKGLLLEIDSHRRLNAMIEFAVLERVPEYDDDRPLEEADCSPRGVRIAPWAASESVTGSVLLAIDSRRRLRASVEVPANWLSTAFLDAWEDLEATLDILDPVGEAHADTGPHPSRGLGRAQNEEYDAGDIWKRGTRYDHTLPPDEQVD